MLFRSAGIINQTKANRVDINDWVKFEIVKNTSSGFNLEMNIKAGSIGIDEYEIKFNNQNYFNTITPLLGTKEGLKINYKKTDAAISGYYTTASTVILENINPLDFWNNVVSVKVGTGGFDAASLRFESVWKPLPKRIGGIQINQIVVENKVVKQERIRGGFELPEFLTRSVSENTSFENLIGDYNLNGKPNELSDAITLYNETKFSDNELNISMKNNRPPYTGARANWDEWLKEKKETNGGKKLTNETFFNLNSNPMKNGFRDLGPFVGGGIYNKSIYLTRYIDESTGEYKKDGAKFLYRIHPWCKYGRKLEEWKANSVSKSQVQVVM